MSQNEDFAANLIIAQDGDVVIVPLLLSRRLGLQAAVFLRQAAYLSAFVKKNNGWFFLEQTKLGDPQGDNIFKRLGSWQDAYGIGPDSQLSIRKTLKKLGLLEESKKGMVHGKLNYKVDSRNYLNFLASLNTNVSPCSNGQTGNPDCTSGKSGNVQSKKVRATYTKEKQEVDLQREAVVELEKPAAAFSDLNLKSKSAGSSNLDDLMQPLLKNALDFASWASLKADFDEEALFAAIQKVIATGQKPFCSAISKLLRPQKMPGGSVLPMSQRKLVEEPLKINPKADETGKSMLAAARKKRLDKASSTPPTAHL